MIGSVMSTPAPSDPNVIAKGGQLGKQEFLQLLVTQLKHQDPLNPADPQEFAAQLAQFSTLEQLISIGDQLEASAGFNQALIEMHNATSAVGLIGKNVVAEGNDVVVGAGPTQVQVGVDGAGGTGVVRLFDASGNEVGSMPLGYLPGGRQTLDISQLGQAAGPGAYTFALEVTDAKGDPVTAKTYTLSRVDGVQYTPNGPVLVSGSRTIALNAVVEISG